MLIIVLIYKIDIIVCIHANSSSPIIGLRNFVIPLRASSFRREELPTIIFVTDISYIEKEWDMISTFPDIFILNVRHYILHRYISILQHCK